MAYIGNSSTTQSFTPAIDYFSGNGSTTAFTLSRTVASAAQVMVVVNNVPQHPTTAFSVSGNTITFTGAPSAGTNNIYVYYTTLNQQVIQPGQGTVGTSQLVDSAVTAAKIASGQTFSLNGITFPATQNASADANTLDDYEEGSWTPSISGATYTGIEAAGRYIKVGRYVWFQGRINWSALSGTTNLFSGLPFTVYNGGNEVDHAMSVTPYVNDGFGSLPTGKGYINGYCVRGGTGITFTFQPISVPANFTATGNVYFCGSYICAS